MTNFLIAENKIKELIEKEFFRGAVFTVYKDKKELFTKTFGYNDFENKILLKEDNIFQGYSMTKPLTVLGFLILMQEGKISLMDRLCKYFPEFENMEMLDPEDETKTIKCETPIMMKHLLTMTSGFTYFGNKNKTQIETGKLLQKVFQKKADGTYYSLEETMKELSHIPLMFEPGTSWKYGVSLDVMGAVIEKVSGKSFREFMKENIFEPIGMKDTDFYLLDATRKTFVNQWSYENDKNTLVKWSEFKQLMQTIDKPPTASFGGSGIFTTAKDYSKFLNVLLDGKTIEGKEIIKKEYLDLMKKDQLSFFGVQKDFKWTLTEGYSYGFGVRVRVNNEQWPQTEVGEFGWDGLLGSTGLVDPKQNLTMCLMLSSNPGHNKLIETEFFDAFYNCVKSNFD